MKTIKDKHYSINHAIDRLKSRYNLSIDLDDYTKMCKLVETKTNAIFISEEKQKNDTQKVFDIFFKETIIRVVWSKNDRCIKTVLPI
jgi:hypothetical protein